MLMSMKQPREIPPVVARRKHFRDRILPWLLWSSLSFIAIAYFFHLVPFSVFSVRAHFFAHVVFTVNTVWWGVLLGIFAVGFLQFLPLEMVFASFRGGSSPLLNILRAALAGTLLDLSRQSVLVLARGIYGRGASLGQLVAFLIATPWNSVSLSLVVYTLVGGDLLFRFLVLSMVVAIVTGLLVDFLIRKKVLKGRSSSEVAFHGPPRLHIPWSWSPAFFVQIWRRGWRESRSMLAWLSAGVLLSAALKTFVAMDTWAQVFGVSPWGMLNTFAVGVLFESVGESPLPLVDNLVKNANAPGNAFLFLMTGVMCNIPTLALLYEQTRSLKTALAVPLLAAVQVLAWSFFLNAGMLNF